MIASFTMIRWPTLTVQGAWWHSGPMDGTRMLIKEHGSLSGCETPTKRDFR
jgi:hypothetical protein